MKEKSKAERTKGLHVRLSIEDWTFLKKYSVDQETSISKMLANMLKRIKKNKENKLTLIDTEVQ